MDFYECDPANNYSWVRNGDFPFIQEAQFSAYFTVAGKGYVVFSDNSVFQFDPDNFGWRRMEVFPGAARVLAFAFVLGNQAYFGGGKSIDYMGAEYNDIWKFDPSLNTWTQVSYIPGVRHSAVAFSIGSKAYVGFGLKNEYGFQTNLWDFYEYDPNYPAK